MRNTRFYQKKLSPVSMEGAQAQTDQESHEDTMSELTVPYTDLEHKVTELAALRVKSLQAFQQMQEIVAQYEGRNDYRFARDTNDQAKRDIANLIEQIGEQAVILAQAMESKHPHPAIEVKNVSEVEVLVDPDPLREWCLKNMPGALLVDQTKIKAAAKTGLLPAEIAKVVTKQKAYIASNLEAYLPTEEKEVDDGR